MSLRQTIDQAIKDIAYDNGAIYRGRTEEEVLENVQIHLSVNYTLQELADCSVELAKLSADDFQNLTCGSEDSQPTHSELLKTLLASIFENI